MLDKYCSRCDSRKPFDQFAKNKARHDGYQSMCKLCDKEKKAKWESRNPEKVANRKKRYLVNNREHYLNLRRLAYQKNKNNGTLKKYSKNLDLHAQTQMRRRTKKHDNGIFTIISKDLRKLKNSNCFYCGEKANTIDHILPINKTGRHSIGNLVAACKSCNSSKKDDFLVVYKIRKIRMKNGNDQD